MMKLNVSVLCLAVLLVTACDNKEPAEQNVAPAVESEKTAMVEQAVPQATEQPVVEEATPQATVAAVTQPQSGEAIYKKSCVACHATGSANAPKLGDKAAWKPRIEKGMNVLLQSAINGVPGTAMVKRGTCNSCTDDDLKAVVEYMVLQSK